jgi:S-DNA-T family DNA segregation ATPase FtsK/SpoIIIE
VVTEAEDALKLMKSLELEMQERYRRLSVGGYRSLEEYNQNRKESRLPYLILMIDELADLMMTAGSAIESPIARLAQMGRAIGIHLILATQRPSVDVLTGIIKANFPCRIAFQVASKVDSRTILDANGAETLLGKGDMLFLPPGVGIPKRLHGSLITTEEIEAIVEHISKQPVFAERVELPDPLQEVSRPLELTPENKDELFDEAARLIAIHQQGSVSLLQRKLKIGYARAARLIDQMEAAGIVGPFDGSKARKVLVSEDWLPEMGIRKDERGMINNE